MMYGSPRETGPGTIRAVRAGLGWAVRVALCALCVTCAKAQEGDPTRTEAAPAERASSPQEGKTAMLTLKSSAFEANGPIPKKYTCEGQDTAPPLEWSGVPAGAKSLALVVDDPDAPDPAAPKRTWVHWVVVDIPPSVSSLPEGGALPKGARVGLNDWKKPAYGGACPPIGRHRYFHKLYALDASLGLEKPTKAELEQAMQGHVLASSELVGTYQKGP